MEKLAERLDHPATMGVMSFRDLPKNWHSRPLTEPPLAADIVDLVVREGDRVAGCVTFLLCDERGRLIQPVTITDTDAGAGEPRDLVELFLGDLAGGIGGLVVAVGRPRGHTPDDAARAWHEAAIAACRRHEVPLIGTYLATVHGVVEMPRWPGLAAVS